MATVCGLHLARVRCSGVLSVSSEPEGGASRQREIRARGDSSEGFGFYGKRMFRGFRFVSGRGKSVVVAASPPTEDAVIITEPLTKDDLVGYLASGCKAKEKWRYILVC